MRTGQAARALSWSAVNTVTTKFASILIGVALARLLGPAEFGTFAVAMIALMAVLSFNELGISLAIVRWPDEPARIAPTVNSIALVTSALLTAGLMAVAGPFAAAMGEPSAAEPVRLMALCVLVNAFGTTSAAVLQREFMQGRRMVADQLNIWLGAVISLALAVLGVGAMSLVAGRLVGTTVSVAVLLYYSPVRFRLGFDARLFAPLMRFGVPLAAASIVVFLLGFADQIIVGSQLGAVQLGAYVLAVNLASWPVQLLSQPLRNVAPAVFARMQSRPDLMGETLLRVSRPLAALSLPGCLALAVCARPVVDLVYGDQWGAAATPLQWLALAAALRILYELAYDYVVIAGRASWLLGVQIVWLLATVPAVAIGVRIGGLGGAALAQVLTALVVVGPAYVSLLRRCGVAPMRLLAGLIWPSIAGATVLMAMIVPVRDSWPPAAILCSCVVVTCAVSAALIARMRPDLRALRQEV